METDLSIGIVGTKFAGGFHAECWAGIEGARVTAVASREESARGAFAARFGIATTHGDYRTLVEDPRVRVVDICAPNFMHAEIALAAFAAGKDVICEKPLATTLEDARRVVEMKNKTGRKLFYAEDWIFAPALARVEAILAEGGIGKPLYFRGKECHNGSHSPFAQTIRQCGGGSVIHLAVHPIGFFQHLLGLPEKVAGHCSGGGEANLLHKTLEGEDWGLGVLTYADGTQAVVEGNYITAGGMEDFIEIFGTDGVVKVQMSLGSPISVYSRKGISYAVEKADFTHGWTRPAIDENWSLGYRQELQHFAQCLRGEGTQMKGTTAEDGRDVMAIIDAIYRSHREGATVPCAR
jgi:predicted dehydrogenase